MRKNIFFSLFSNLSCAFDLNMLKYTYKLFMRKTLRRGKMKKFQYKFTTLSIIFIIAGILAGATCVALNAVRFFKLLDSSVATSSDYMSVMLATVIGLLAVVILIAVLFNSYYAVENKNFVAKWGFFANKIALKDITRIAHFKLSDKLVIYYSVDNFFVINAKLTDYEGIIDELKSTNPKIIYIENSENNDY